MYMKRVGACVITSLCVNNSATLVRRNPFIALTEANGTVIATALLPDLHKAAQFVVDRGHIKMRVLNKKPLQLEEAEGLGG